MIRNLRALPAALLVAVVLVAAMAGGATAAKMITGKQIKNNTVTTKDIKNNNLTSKDVRNSTLTGGDVRDNSLSGADVANGSVSAADLAADAKNEVRTVDVGDSNLPTCTDNGLSNCLALGGLSLSPGTWFVTGTMTLMNLDNAATDEINRCGLLSASTLLAEANTPLAAEGAPGESETVAFTQVIQSATPVGVSLRCSEMVGESMRAGSPTLTAVKIS
ncbi:hypothetical protein [Nocardioides lijunqiniae]|uniref:hypothetical protein n=1 Tax=Nocardioides lijunqiniae TaxID=2760832 RepID=UPI001878AE67|nr:hypothetical protein [Nocardioides lijunqiniae]